MFKPSKMVAILTASLFLIQPVFANTATMAPVLPVIKPTLLAAPASINPNIALRENLTMRRISSNSNLVSKRTRKGDIISYDYDALNRLTQKSYPDGSSIDYDYDLASRLTQTTDNRHQTTDQISYSYDNLNRILSVQTQNFASLQTINYQYDPSGNRTKLTYPDGSSIDYNYDQLNRLTQISDQGGVVLAG